MADVGAEGRKLEIRKVIDRTLEAINDNRLNFILLSLALYGLPNFGAQLFAAEVQTNPGAAVMAMIAGIVIIFAGSVAQIGLTLGAGASFDGRRLTFGEMLQGGVRKMLPYIGLIICMVAAIGLGLGLLIVPGVILALAWSVAPAVLLFEDKRVFETFKRSAALTKENRWRILGLFGIYIGAVFLVSFIAGLALGLPLMLVGGRVFGTALAGVVGGCLGQIVGAAGAAALYYELRAAKEGFTPKAVASVFD